MRISVEVDMSDVQIAGCESDGNYSVILGSEEIGITLLGTKENLKDSLQEMMSILDDLD